MRIYLFITTDPTAGLSSKISILAKYQNFIIKKFFEIFDWITKVLNSRLFKWTSLASESIILEKPDFMIFGGPAEPNVNYLE